MRYHVIDTRDPFEFEKAVQREQVSRLNKEIRRLKIKCGEDFTSDELLRGFGNPPDMYGPRSVGIRHGHIPADVPREDGPSPAQNKTSNDLS